MIGYVISNNHTIISDWNPILLVHLKFSLAQLVDQSVLVNLLKKSAAQHVAHIEGTTNNPVRLVVQLPVCQGIQTSLPSQRLIPTHWTLSVTHLCSICVHLWFRFLTVQVDIPAPYTCPRLHDGRGHAGRVDGNVVLEAVLADVGQQPLQLGHLDHAIAAEGEQRIVGQIALAHVGADLARQSSVVTRR